MKEVNKPKRMLRNFYLVALAVLLVLNTLPVNRFSFYRPQNGKSVFLFSANASCKFLGPTLTQARAPRQETPCPPLGAVGGGLARAWLTQARKARTSALRRKGGAFYLPTLQARRNTFFRARVVQARAQRRPEQRQQRRAALAWQ